MCARARGPPCRPASVLLCTVLAAIILMIFLVRCAACGVRRGACGGVGSDGFSAAQGNSAKPLSSSDPVCTPETKKWLMIGAGTIILLAVIAAIAASASSSGGGGDEVGAPVATTTIGAGQAGQAVGGQGSL